MFWFFQLAGINEEYQSIVFQKSAKQDMLSIQDIVLDTLVDEAKKLKSKLLSMTELEDAELVVESDAKVEIVFLENQLALISSLLCTA